MPLLERNKLVNTTQYMLRQLGRSKEEAISEVNETVRGIKTMTTYAGSKIIDLEAMNKCLESLITEIGT